MKLLSPPSPCVLFLDPNGPSSALTLVDTALFDGRRQSIPRFPRVLVARCWDRQDLSVPVHPSVARSMRASRARTQRGVADDD